MNKSTRTSIMPLIMLGGIVLVFLLLTVPTIDRYGISWDEQWDMETVQEYLTGEDGWLRGSETDLANTRLPMYTTAVVLKLLGTEGVNSARLVSLFVAALALLGVYTFCRREFDRRTGLLACAVLATSPYFLSHARIALSESDIFITLGLIWSLVSVSVLREKLTMQWAGLAGVTLGLALSAKISAVAVLPVVFFLLLKRQSGVTPPGDCVSMPKKDVTKSIALMSLLFVSIFGIWGLRILTGHIPHTPTLSLVHYLIVFSAWLLVTGHAWLNRATCLPPMLLGFYVLSLASLTFFVIPPVHTTNPNNFVALLEALFVYYGRGVSVYEAFVQHLSFILFKSSLAMGIWLLVSLVAALVQWKKRSRLTLPLLFFLAYFIFLLDMPWAQTFYMMPIFPIVAIFGADQFFRVFDKSTALAIVLGLVISGNLVYDLYRVYPDYHLNGYQYVGERYYAGRSTVGIVSIVHTREDGVQQVLEWADRNIEPGKTVVAYINPKHIIKAILPEPKFRLIDGTTSYKSIMRRADYVITSINADISHGVGADNPTGSIFKRNYDRDVLERDFVQVYTIKRAFDFEVASVWRKKSLAD